uniref:Beta-hexosaminidase subunit alpha n=1 Tax=Nothobranchius furzeri TaxID=105023 RepID=A0A8C6LIA2_NOTFU
DAAFIRYHRLIFPDHTADNLSVSAGHASVNAESVWGVLRGLETFSQLVYQDDFGTHFVNRTDIEDSTQFQYRGLLLDTSRHYLPVPVILKTLDAMAYSKFNVFHWHIVDDPSFPYQSRTFPNLSNKGAFHPVSHVYTQSDVKRVISYARMRGIRVLPEFDSPGHTNFWGRGQSDVDSLLQKRHPSGTFGPVNPALPSTYQFMASLFKEVASVSTFFTVCFCRKSNPHIRAFMQKVGFGVDLPKLDAFYMERIVNITSALNKTSIVWQDVFDYLNIHRRIWRTMIMDFMVEVWKHGCYLCEVRRLTKAELRVILATPWYLDQPGPTHNWARYYVVEQKKLVTGWGVNLWGEYVDASNLAPRLCDERQTSSVERAFPRLQDFRCKLLRRGIQAEPLYVGHMQT